MPTRLDLLWKPLSREILPALLLIFLSQFVIAQTQGRITGRISDSTGAVIADAVSPVRGGC